MRLPIGDSKLPSNVVLEDSVQVGTQDASKWKQAEKNGRVTVTRR